MPSIKARDRNLQFGAIFSTDFSVFLQWIFYLFSWSFVHVLIRKSPQNVEKIARFPGGEKSAESCHVSGRHSFLLPKIILTHFFFVISSVIFSVRRVVWVNLFGSEVMCAPLDKSRGNNRAVLQKGGFGECIVVPVFGVRRSVFVPSFQFWGSIVPVFFCRRFVFCLVPTFRFLYLCSGLWGSGEHPPKPPFGNQPFANSQTNLSSLAGKCHLWNLVLRFKFVYLQTCFLIVQVVWVHKLSSNLQGETEKNGVLSAIILCQSVHKMIWRN